MMVLTTKNISIERLGFTNNFLTSRRCKRIFDTTGIEAQTKKEQIWSLPYPKVAWPVSLCCRVAKVLSLEKTGHVGLSNLSQSDLFTNRF